MIDGEQDPPLCWAAEGSLQPRLSLAEVIKPPGRERRAAPTGRGRPRPSIIAADICSLGLSAAGEALDGLQRGPAAAGWPTAIGDRGTGTGGWTGPGLAPLRAAMMGQQGHYQQAQGRCEPGPRPAGVCAPCPVGPRGARPPRLPPVPRARPPPSRDSRRWRSRRGVPPRH